MDTEKDTTSTTKPAGATEEERAFVSDDNDNNNSSSRGATLGQWLFLVSQMGFVSLLVGLGAIHWNGCDGIATLAGWAVCYGIVVFINNVALPFWRYYHDAAGHQQVRNNNNAGDNNGGSQQRHVTKLEKVLNVMILFAMGWGGALTFPNFGEREELCYDGYALWLYYFSFYAVASGVVWIAVSLLWAPCHSVHLGAQRQQEEQEES